MITVSWERLLANSVIVVSRALRAPAASATLQAALAQSPECYSPAESDNSRHYPAATFT
jgi:hypothetical protein